MKVTKDQLETLRMEAREAGDYDMAHTCDLALEGYEPAIAECERAIEAAKSAS